MDAKELRMQTVNEAGRQWEGSSHGKPAPEGLTMPHAGSTDLTAKKLPGSACPGRPAWELLLSLGEDSRHRDKT